ncbi:hypothetical protein VUJ46_04295 [Chryseobacterium sp. MYb264]|uniref:hypothetical protein n=1 Tax=Chryseobacterium sp. MYb264 TaxID=2745153 RepID=UPI002E12B88E|nr:hypothetical protein VUJ46_04295 [Chryseobacterium sp. MYb264]
MKFLLLLTLFFMITSCAISKKKDIISDLYMNNGNVFYITSTYINRKIVWSYSNDKVIIYTLTSKNKILDKKEELVEKPVDISSINLNDNYEMDKCMELDGDLLGYQIKQNEVIKSKEYPVNTKCFISNKYENILYNKLKDDIIKYNLLLYK